MRRTLTAATGVVHFVANRDEGVHLVANRDEGVHLVANRDEGVHLVANRDEDDGYITLCLRSFVDVRLDKPSRVVTCVWCIVRPTAWRLPYGIL
jgi:hypothetical protein